MHPKILELKPVSCISQCSEDFECALTDAICYFIKEGLKINQMRESAIKFLQLKVDLDIVRELLHETKYQIDLLAMILDNKIEFEVVLENKVFVDEIYKKTNDEKFLPFLSVPLKMKELSNKLDSIDKIFQNIIPSKEWEQFLAVNNPVYSKHYLKNYVSDFGGLKMIFERVCDECLDIDELIDIFYIDYLKDVSFKNFKDTARLIKILIETKKYKRLRELQKYIDEDTICQLLRSSLEEPEIMGYLVGHTYANDVVKDYIELMNQ